MKKILVAITGMIMISCLTINVANAQDGKKAATEKKMTCCMNKETAMTADSSKCKEMKNDSSKCQMKGSAMKCDPAKCKMMSKK